jgi:spermidine/putrescine-binding protein
MASKVRRLLKNAPDGIIVRRDFLRFAGGAAAVVGATRLIGATRSAAAAEGGQLALFTWQGYDLTDPFKQWRADHGIEQTVKYINNQFDVVSILKGPGGDQFDSSSANQAYTQLFQRLGLMTEISLSEVPSLAKMYPFFRQSPIWSWGAGSGSYNSVPWTWGAIGINYLTDRVAKPGSWNVLIDPKNKGRVATYDDAYNNVSIAAIALGIDLTKISRKDLDGPIRDWLMKLKANLKTISVNLGDQQTLLVNKEVDYMNVGLTLFVTGGRSQGATNIGFEVPSEGGFGFCDAAFVTPWAPHKANAFAFCEALLGGHTAAIAANELAGGVVVPDVVPLLNPETRSLYPYDKLDDYLSNRLKFAVDFTPTPGQDIVSFDDINGLWQQVKAS